MYGIFKCRKFLKGRCLKLSAAVVSESYTTPSLLRELTCKRKKVNKNKKKGFEQLVRILDNYVKTRNDAEKGTSEETIKLNVIMNIRPISSTKSGNRFLGEELSNKADERTFHSIGATRDITEHTASSQQTPCSDMTYRPTNVKTKSCKEKNKILSNSFIDEESEILDYDITSLDDQYLEGIGTKFAIEDVDPDVISSGHVKKPAAEKEYSVSKKQMKTKNDHPKRPPVSTMEDKDKIAKIKQNMSLFEKERNLSINLRTFCDVCINAKLIRKAHSAIFYYCLKSRKSKNSPKVKDVVIFDILLAGWASKGNLTKIKQVFQLMKEENVPYSLQSYAAYFECIARQKDHSQSEIEHVLSMMKNNGHSVDDLIIKSKFSRDQKEKVIEAIQQCMPDYKPKPPPFSSSYSCDLLQKLNKSSCHHSCILPPEVSTDDLRKLSSQQFQREIKMTVPIQSVSTHQKINNNTYLVRKQLEKCEEEWKASIRKTFLKNRQELSQQMLHYSGVSLYPYLVVMKADSYVEIIMEEVRKLASLSESYSPGLSYLHREMGEKIMILYSLWNKQQSGMSKKLIELYEKYLEYFNDPELIMHYSPREYWEVLKSTHFEGPSVDSHVIYWPYHIQLGVGRFLYNVLLSSVKINAKLFKPKEPPMPLPAFYYVYRYNTHMQQQIKPDPVIIKLYKDAALEEMTFDTNLLPMLTPPLPWTSVTLGGFLLLEIPFVRLPATAIQQQIILKNTPPHQLYPSFDSLNALGCCPWVINKPMLDLIIEVFNSNGNEELDIPKSPSALPVAPKYQKTMSKERKHLIKRERRTVKRKNAETYSLWCDTLYKLSVANHFREKVFWFPHNLDFRGRIYPTPPHFNHLGGDMARSILLFARGEPLGKNGLDWLKIHLVNLTGMKKREPISERLQFANEMIEEIMDSANFPFTGRKWWMKSDEPWQTLACCKEVAAAVRSPNPAAYICHFPIHQDGSCNGLQHYAALGRDQQGAEQVNLHPSDRPQDVYSGVAAIVERERSKDAANGIQVAQVLDGHIKRKVVKQTVMTVVYGVTRYGARLQILKQLEDLPEFPQEFCHKAAAYLVQKTFLSLEEMFTATKEIQDWFTQCAREIARIREQPVQWVTPLGFPITQPYHKPSVRTTLPSLKKEVTTYISRCNFFTHPNVMKQKNAFAPNFVHSLDSSHMMLTSLFCQKEGITFVSVHDCYWTHAKDIAKMNKICREQFVALHSQPILDNLSEFFHSKYGYPISETEGDLPINIAKKEFNSLLCNVPKKGKFKLENVLKSVYFFS